jgi:hypothetical protein
MMNTVVTHPEMQAKYKDLDAKKKTRYNVLMDEIQKNRRMNKNMNFVPLACSLHHLKREFKDFYTKDLETEHLQSWELIKIRNVKIRFLFNVVSGGDNTMK